MSAAPGPGSDSGAGLDPDPDPGAPVAGPRVSVVTPAWNAAATLAETAASVRAQTYPDWEMLIVDDGSTDGTGALAARLAAEEPRIRVMGWPDNRGPATARNAAIRAARGRFLAFLDADDLWLPEKLARQVPVLEAGHPFVFAAYRRIDAGGRELGVVAAPARVTRAAALRGNPIGCLTAIYDREALGRVEMPDLPRRQDYALWLRLLRATDAVGLREVLAVYRVRRGSLSADKWRAARATWRVLREAEGLALSEAAWCFASYAAKAVARRV